MIGEDRVIVLDVDGTICPTKRPDQTYAELLPVPEMVEQIHRYRADGYRIILFTARRMRSFGGNVGELNAKMLPELVTWLERHAIPFDEIHVGKPWPGASGFYVDDRAIRPAEFLRLSPDEIDALVARDSVADALPVEPRDPEVRFAAQEPEGDEATATTSADAPTTGGEPEASA